MPGLNPLAPVFTPRAANVRPPVVDRIANDPAFNVEDVLGGIDVCSSDFEQVSKTQKVLTLACHPGLLPDGAEETPEMRAQVIGDALAVLEAVDYMPNSKTPKGEATTPPGSRPGEGVGTTYIDVTSNPGRVGSLVQQCIATMCGAPSPDISLARLVGFDLKRGPGDPFVGDYASQLHRVILFLNFCDCNREREEGSPHPWVLFLINVESRYLDRPSAAPLEQRIAAQEAATASLRTELRSGINQLTAAQEATNKSARTTAQALGRIEAKLSGPEAIPPGWPPATSGTAYAAAAPSEPRPRPRVEELTSSWGTTPQAIPASAPATDPQPGNRVQSPGFPMDVVDAQVGHPQLTRVHPGDPLESRKVKKNRWIAPDGIFSPVRKPSREPTIPAAAAPARGAPPMPRKPHRSRHGRVRVPQEFDLSMRTSVSHPSFSTRHPLHKAVNELAGSRLADTTVASYSSKVLKFAQFCTTYSLWVCSGDYVPGLRGTPACWASGLSTNTDSGLRVAPAEK
eukprot:m.389923 g.389923  ORF g.389923 m.389923 type:complete len:513 (-) comp16753_c0_seq61:10408-11946(-)